MAATVTSAFELIDRASGTIRGLRRSLRELESDARSAGRAMDELAGRRVALQMETLGRQERVLRQETQTLGGDADRASQSVGRLEQRVQGLETQSRRTRSEVSKLDGVMKVAKWAAVSSVLGGVVRVVGDLGGGVVELLPRVADLGGAGAGLGAAYIGAGEAMGVAKLAIQGLSQALQGNKKALKDLTPEGRAFVAELRSMHPELQRLQESAQKGLFGGVGDLLGDLRRQAPQLDAIVASSSRNLGGLARFAGGQLSSPGFMSTLTTVAGEGDTAFGAAGRSAIYLGEALGQVLVAARPLVDWMSRMTVQESRAALAHAKLARETGELGHYFDRTRSAIHLFGDVGKSVIGGVRGVLHAAADDGDSLWHSIDRSAHRFDEWANSVSGQASMARFFRQLRPELTAVADATGSVVNLLSDAAGGSGGLVVTARVFETMADDADRLLKALGPAGKVLGGMLTTAYALNKLHVFGAIGTLRRWSSGGLGGGDSVVGSRGIATKAGSLANPLAVLSVDRSGVPVTGTRAAAAAEAEGKTAGGVILPQGVKDTRTAAEKAATGVTTAEEGAAGAGLLSRAAGKVSAAGGRVLGGLGIAGTGLLAAQLGEPILASAVGGKAAHAAGSVVSGASIGAGLGSVVPGVGTVAGAVGGGLVALINQLSTDYRGQAKAAVSTLSQTAPKGSLSTGQLADLQASAGGITGMHGAYPWSGQDIKLIQEADRALKSYASTGNQAALDQVTQKARALQHEWPQNASSLNALIKVMTRAKQEGTDAMNGLAAGAQSALVRRVVPYFKQMSAEAGKSLDDIKLQARIGAAMIPETLGKGTLAARQAVATNFKIAAQDVAKSMSDGVISAQQGIKEIDSLLSQALRAMGVNVSPSLVGAIGVGGANSLLSRAQTGGAGASSDAGKSTKGGSGHGQTYATGGRIPGPARGDHVPLLSRGGGLLGIADGGELVVNQHTESKVDRLLGRFGTRLSRMVDSERTPHYATGGRVAGGGTHWDRLLAAANLVSSRNFPYVYGGGHENPAHLEPFDCSGAVSYVTQQAGYKVPTTVSGDMGSWGFPAGSGTATIFYNPVHTFMRIGNRYFGTSGFARPGGGAGWFTEAPGASYLSEFSRIHLPDLGSDAGAWAGGMSSIKQPKWRGPGGALGALGNAILKRVTKAANAKLARSMPAGAAGGGQALELGLPAGGRTVGASEFGGPGDPGTGSTGYRGDNLNAHPDSYAELNMGTALGGLPYMTPLRVSGPRGSEVLYKRDIGAGGGPVSGHPRAIDLWYRAAEDLGINGLGLVKVEQLRKALGGRLNDAPSWGGWHAKGADMTVRRPTVFGAGEAGPERVQITPAGTRSGSGVAISNVRVNVAGGIGERRVRVLLDQHLRRFAQEVADEIEAGAEQDAGQVIS